MPMERLSWRNRFVKELVQELNDYSEADCEGKTPQTISGPDNLVILRVSFEEWEKLFSSTYTGADICYPEESDSVRWILQRAVECPVSICDLIIDCINNNPATMQAIIDKLKESEDFNDFLAQRALGVVPGATAGTVVEACDNSILAGQIIAAVDAMDTTNADFLQQVELGTNDEERIVAIVSGIPGAGSLPADEILDALQRLLEDFTENYASAVTLEWKDEVSRALYCLAKEDPECKLTFAQIFEYFQNRAGSTLTLGSILQNIFEFLVNGDFGTDELVASGMFALQLGFMMAGGTFAGMNIPLLTAIARDAEPSNRWETWDPCSPPGERTPVINSLWDPTHTAGTLSGPDGEGFWVATSGTRASDEAITLMDVDDRPFVFEDVTYPDGEPDCQVWLLDGVILHLACTVGDQYTGQTIDEYTATWTPGGHRTMRFKMVAPEE